MIGSQARSIRELYALARDCTPRALLQRPISAGYSFVDARAMLLCRPTPRVQEWIEFLRTRLTATNPGANRSADPWGVSLNPSLLPFTRAKRYGVLRTALEPVAKRELPAIECGTPFAAVLTDRRGQTAFGFATFWVGLTIWPGRSPRIEPEVLVHAVWIDPMLRGLSYSHMLAEASSRPLVS